MSLWAQSHNAAEPVQSFFFFPRTGMIEAALVKLLEAAGGAGIGSLFDRLANNERSAVRRAFRRAADKTLRRYPKLEKIDFFASWLQRSSVGDAFIAVLSEPRLNFDSAAFVELLHSSMFDPKTFPEKMDVEEFVAELKSNFIEELWKDGRALRFYEALTQPRSLHAEPKNVLPWTPPVSVLDRKQIVERPAVYKRLRTEVLGAGRDPEGLVTALHGTGGFGKSTLVIQLCNDESIQREFVDGLLWVELGETPDLIFQLGEAFRALTRRSPGFVSVNDAAIAVANELSRRRCLIVIDDVWKPEHLRPFLRGGDRCARVITTRDLRVIGDATPISVEEMTEAEAVRLLESKLRGIDTAALHKELRVLARRLGGWPLLLALAGSTLKSHVSQGDSLSEALAFVERELDIEGPTAFDMTNEDHRDLALSLTVDFSIRRLEESDRRRLLELSIFPSDVAVPVQVAAVLWDQKREAAVKFLRRLRDLSLLRYDSQGARLHDVMRSHLSRLLAEEEDLSAVHGQLVDAYARRLNMPSAPTLTMLKKSALASDDSAVVGATEWWRLPADEVYPWIHLAYHMVASGREEILRQFLLDLRWLEAKARLVGLPALLADFTALPPDEDLSLVVGALRLSGHVIGAEPSQLRTQIAGRLIGIDRPLIRQLVGGAALGADEPWLRLRSPSLIPPTGSLMRTLAGERSGVSALATSPDGRHLACGTWDGMVRVWDIEAGSTLREMPDHAGGVSAVAVAPGGLVISGSWDGTVRMGAPGSDAGRILLTTAGVVYSVAVTPDGDRVLAGLWDGTVRIWNVVTNTEEPCAVEHAGEVTTLAVSPDGARVITGSADGHVKTWTLSGNNDARVLAQHTDGVNLVTIASDGRDLISGSWAGTVIVSSLDTAEERRMASPVPGATAVAVTPDGHHAISGCRNGALSVWSLESGMEERTLAGHADAVTVLTVTKDGRRAISGYRDGTIKVWNLETETNESQPAEPVSAVALTPDGRWALSGCKDGTVKLWSAGSGTEERKLPGTGSVVTALALSRDGSRAIACFADGKVKVWNTETGTEQAIEIPGDAVQSVAVTAEGGDVVIGCSDGSVRVWELSSGSTSPTILRYDEEAVDAPTVTPDGMYALSRTRDGRVTAWDLTTGAEWVASWYPAEAIAAAVPTSGGGTIILGFRDGTIVKCDPHTGAEQGRWRSMPGLTTVAMAPDQNPIVCSLANEKLTIETPIGPKHHTSFTADAVLKCCAMTEDGLQIVVGDQSGRVHFLLLDGLRST